MNGTPLEVKVWSKMACFTRPENKVERVSYPVPTPSAARGVLEAILWKPEFEWRVREIVVLKPIRYLGFLRNEVNSKASPSSTGISITDDRAQRQTLALCSGPKSDDYVEYIFRADVVVKPGVEHDSAKYRDMFRRRVAGGQCFHRPYLGCREFAADFATPVAGADTPIDNSRDLGLMLFDIAFGPSGSNYPMFFEAKMENGVIRIPDSLYDQREALRI